MTGLGRGLSANLARWRAPRAVHDPGKIVADLAAAVALGGDCLADIAVLREQPDLAGPVASDPVVSRLVSVLAADVPRALKAIRAARSAARERAWALAGDNAPGADGGLVTVDLDATIVIAHSDKDQAAPTWKKTFGFHPMTAWADHGAGGNGESLAIVLRAGNAGSNTAADHIETTRLALAQLPRRQRRRVLVRTDSGGGTHDFLTWLTAPSRRLRYSVGMTITEDMQAAILKVPATAWTPAYDGDGQVRDGAWVADITGLLDLRPGRPGCGSSCGKNGRTPGRSCGSPISTATGSPPSPPTPGKASSPTWSSVTAAGPLRRPDPLRQGHRAAEPAPQGLRPEPGLVRDRRPGLRAAGLDPDARPDRDRPPLGTETAPPAPVLRRRPARARRPPPAAPARRTMALGRRDHRRGHPPAGPPLRLTSRNRHYDQEGEHQGPWNPAHPARQPGSQARPGPKITPSRHLRPAHQRRERSRLT